MSIDLPTQGSLPWNSFSPAFTDEKNEDADAPQHAEQVRLQFRYRVPFFHSASVFAEIEMGRVWLSESLFLYRRIGIPAPLRPTSHIHFDFRITGQLQGKSLDRGSSTRLSVTHRSLGWHYSSFAEKLLQLRFRFKATVLGDQFFPIQMSRAGNASTTEFTDTAGIDELYGW